MLGCCFSFLAGCHKDISSQQEAHPHYQLGKGWKGKDSWFYPYEQFSYHATGIASRDKSSQTSIADDGEVWTSQEMVGSHQTLQLPSIVSVHNLQNGRIVRVKLIRRGPQTSNRIIGLSSKAADLLGMGDDAPVEITEDEVASRSIIDGLSGAPKLDVEAAPVGQVTAQDLDSKGVTVYGSNSPKVLQHTKGLGNLPLTWTQGSIESYRLYLLLGKFSTQGTAEQVALRCNGNVVREMDMGGLNWSVKSGPYGNISQADQALEQSRGCGVEGERIIVE
ncbi:hypothetical protein E3D00_00110 [Swingsia samuiensis]|uniref:RlpA-like protein double-psi beta-barrel domain-containing protein n=2 Tax=Swingsia samuiensis TaxID=1293412 RepID=A0A4Y6UNG6_9PROT|nr:hypothetical protein E3D00_00110 [Swingsia samuiensis]